MKNTERVKEFASLKPTGLGHDEVEWLDLLLRKVMRGEVQIYCAPHMADADSAMAERLLDRINHAEGYLYTHDRLERSNASTRASLVACRINQLRGIMAACAKELRYLTKIRRR